MTGNGASIVLRLFYAFIVGRRMVEETAILPAREISTTDVPVFAHALVSGYADGVTR